MQNLKSFSPHQIKIVNKTVPIVGLIVLVLGGIYTGWLTPVEAGGAVLQDVGGLRARADEARRFARSRHLGPHGDGMFSTPPLPERA